MEECRTTKGAHKSAHNCDGLNLALPDGVAHLNLVGGLRGWNFGGVRGFTGWVVAEPLRLAGIVRLLRRSLGIGRVLILGMLAAGGSSGRRIPSRAETNR
jgi:hypothetical protein